MSNLKFQCISTELLHIWFFKYHPGVSIFQLGALLDKSSYKVVSWFSIFLQLKLRDLAGQALAFIQDLVTALLNFHTYTEQRIQIFPIDSATDTISPLNQKVRLLGEFYTIKYNERIITCCFYAFYSLTSTAELLK